MRIAHFSDVHYCAEHLKEVDRCFRYAVNHATLEAPDAAVISGDLFDRRVDLHSSAVHAVCSQVKRLADVMPVLILQGTLSHDVPGSLDVFRTIGGRYPVHVADNIGRVVLTRNGDGFMWNNASEPGFKLLRDDIALFSCLPSVHKGNVAATAGAENAALAAGEFVYQLMRGWSVGNLAARAAGVPSVVISHGTVAACITEHGVPMHGTDHEFTTGALFASEASAIMLGHIHQFQQWEQDGRRIAYPGSVGRLHFGEQTAKGYLDWHVEADRADLEFIETPAKRLIEINFDGVPNMAELEQAAADASGAFVRVRWNVDEEHRDSIDKKAIEAMFGGAEVVKLEGRIKPIQRQRAAGISQAPSLDEKVAKWCETTGNKAAPLLERLALLHAMEPEQIANGETVSTANKQENAA